MAKGHIGSHEHHAHIISSVIARGLRGQNAWCFNSNESGNLQRSKNVQCSDMVPFDRQGKMTLLVAMGSQKEYPGFLGFAARAVIG